MAVVQIADVVVPAEFTAYQVENSMVSTALFQSGVAVENGEMKSQLQAGAMSFAVPFWADLGEQEPDVTSDDQTVLSVANKITASRQQALIEAEPPKFPGAEDHEPPFPPFFTVHIAPSQGDERGNSSSDTFWAVQATPSKKPSDCCMTSIRFASNCRALLDNDKRYDFSVVLPEPESREQMPVRFRTGIEDYFHVNVSRENRVIDAYVLSLEPNGNFLRPSLLPTTEWAAPEAFWLCLDACCSPLGSPASFSQARGRSGPVGKISYLLVP
jgi:hypothetical protein